MTVCYTGQSKQQKTTKNCKQTWNNLKYGQTTGLTGSLLATCGFCLLFHIGVIYGGVCYVELCRIPPIVPLLGSNSNPTRRLTVGAIQISKGRRLVGFEFEARRGTISGIQISEGLRLVGFEFEARRGTGNEREIISRVFPGTPLDSRYEQWNCESNLYRVTIDLLPHFSLLNCAEIIDGWCIYTTDFSTVINYDLAFDNPFISETYKIICLWSYILDYTDITCKMNFFR
jgi:hypothetical protein